MSENLNAAFLGMSIIPYLPRKEVLTHQISLVTNDFVPFRFEFHRYRLAVFVGLRFVTITTITRYLESSLEDASTVAYLVTSPFSLTEEFEINPLDPETGIEWGLPVGELRLSRKDKAAPSLKERVGEGKLPG